MRCQSPREGQPNPTQNCEPRTGRINSVSLDIIFEIICTRASSSFGVLVLWINSSSKTMWKEWTTPFAFEVLPIKFPSNCSNIHIADRGWLRPIERKLRRRKRERERSALEQLRSMQTANS